MAFKEDEIRKIVQQNGDRFVAVYGPSAIAGCVIWEVWTDKRNEYVTRFFEELADGTFAIYGSFEELAGYLDRRHNEIARQLEEVQWERATQLAEVQARNRLKEQQVASEVLGRHVALFAALGCCVVAMLAVIFIIWSGKTDPRLIWLAGFLMASSLASSVAFLFGKFIPIRLPW